MAIRLDEVEQTVVFACDKEKIVGRLGIPPSRPASERRAAFVIMHGFGGTKEDGSSTHSAQLFAELGYVTLRFDHRGCGESAGARGLITCDRLIADALAALEYLQTRPEVDPRRIGLLGGSLGGAVAIHTTGADDRVAACISCGGWGDGEEKFKLQHASAAAWQRFTAMLEEGRRRKQRGETMMVPRFDIVPIPPAIRSGLPQGSIMEFPFDVADSLFRFRPIDMVGRITPRPLLLLHPANDPVTPCQQSIDLFRHAGQPTDLHLISSIDHFMLSENNWLALDIVKNWLRKYFPASAS